jgi:hypothetical protein
VRCARVRSRTLATIGTHRRCAKRLRLLARLECAERRPLLRCPAALRGSVRGAPGALVSGSRDAPRCALLEAC